MNTRSQYEFQHVCPRNCFSNCMMISRVENDQIMTLSGKRTHPYSQGKLCAKGYSYIERNDHQDRLKYPYYQEVKGSGRFKQITWKKAFELIECEILNIQKKHGHLLPLALYKGSGNVGIHHYVTDHFFTSLGGTTRIFGSSTATTGFEAIEYDMGTVKMSNPSMIKDSTLIILWGANPAATNIHLIPYIIEAKAKGGKVVVIDPVYTQTAELADLYIQLRPSTDGALATLLVKELLKADCYDKEFLEQHSYGYEDYLEAIGKNSKDNLIRKCGVVEDAITLLAKWVKAAEAISHVIGTGLLKHSNGGQNVREIEALAAIHGDIGKKGGGIFFRRKDSRLFQNQLEVVSKDTRVIHLNRPENRIPPSRFSPPIEMLWVSGANPLVQEAEPQFLAEFFAEIPFVVTVDLFMTPTAKMSNLILPTTSHFEEMDIVTSYWHKEISLNEKAVSPYYESLSEWRIMTELAPRLREIGCSFPIHASEEEYLNAQFTEAVENRYFIKNVSELKNKQFTASSDRIVWERRKFATATKQFHFFSTEAEAKGLQALPLFVDGPSPTEELPFWLITPHHPYTFNSQFHFLKLSDSEEAIVEIHPKAAEKLSIDDGEVVKISNQQGSIGIKVAYSHRVPTDILVIHQGWYPDSDVNINKLTPPLPTDMGNKGTAFYDTFVRIEKL